MRTILPLTRAARALLLLPVIGLLAGLLISFLVTPRYVSTAVIAFEETAGDSDPAKLHHNLVDFFIRCQDEAMSRASLSEIVQRPEVNLYSDERQRLPLEDVIDTMRREIQVKIVDRPGFSRERTTVFQIAFPAPDPLKAQLATGQLVARFIDAANRNVRSKEFSEAPQAARTRMDQLESRVAELEKRLGIPAPPLVLPDTVPVTAVVIEPASLPDRPVYPVRYLFMAFGFGAGAVVLLVLLALMPGSVLSSRTSGTSAGS